MKKTVQSFTKNLKGFTLVELLIVIAIIAILAVVVAVIINPLELRRRSNDAVRLSDLANLQQAINVTLQESTASGNNTLCASGITGTACTGESEAGTRVTNGTGWVTVNLSNQNAVSVPTLPIDPINDDTGTLATSFYYRYCATTSAHATRPDVWEINANLESVQQTGKEAIDGGNDNTLYETGSNLNLIAVSGEETICAY